MCLIHLLFSSTRYFKQVHLKPKVLPNRKIAAGCLWQDTYFLLMPEWNYFFLNHSEKKGRAYRYPNLVKNPMIIAWTLIDRSETSASTGEALSVMKDKTQGNMQGKYYETCKTNETMPYIYKMYFKVFQML